MSAPLFCAGFVIGSFAFHIGPELSFFEVITLFTDIKGVTVLTLSAGRVPALFTLAVYIPISAASTKLTLAGPGAYAGRSVITAFDPVSAFILLAEPLKDALAAIFTVDVIGMFNLVIQFQEVIDLNSTPGAMGNFVLSP
jgi:hypothetical protein